MKTSHPNVYQLITNQIINAIENGVGDFKLPWHRGAQSILRPANIASRRPYRGVNILCLWAVSDAAHYTSGLWGTFRQWRSIGASVRNGEKATFIVFYKEISSPSDDKSDKKLVARATPVFSAEQVDGYAPPSENLPLPDFEDYDQAESFIAGLNATICHGDNQAFYHPKSDSIYRPHRATFVGTATSSPAESYYATLFHELTHWSGAPHRCNRDLSGRFGSEAYSMEELVAELGAAFLCAQFGVSNSPREDHAQYLAHWLSVLKSDKRAIFTAANQASHAVDFLTSKTVS